MNKWHLRFAVTANCNFNCKYCNTNNNLIPELSEKEIKEILEAALDIGIRRIHWTGGEPLVKKDLLKYIEYASKLGYTEQAITTNGFLLEEKAEDLIKAGISRVNVSLDTMKRETFKKLTGKDGFDKVLNGIYKVLDVSNVQIKINMVVMKENIEEVNDFIKFATAINKKYSENRVIIRFLQFFPCNPNQLNEEGQEYWKEEYITEQDIINTIQKNGNSIKNEQNKVVGDNPTIKYYRINDEITIGILAMFSWKYPCGGCFKLRITPYGYASCCLNDEKMYKLIGLSTEEKLNTLKEIVNRRNTIIENREDRKHYRKKLGEVRFGEKGKEIELEKFYKILDEEKKIGKERYKIPISVQLILMDDKKNVLLLKRKSTGFGDGKYGFVGGHVESNEEVRKAIIREAKEEIGIDIKEEDLYFKSVMDRKVKDDVEYVDFIFTVTKWTGDIKNMEPQKCSEIKWFDTKKLPENIIDFEKYILENNNQNYIPWGWNN